MARRRYRRYKRNSGRWAGNIRVINDQLLNAAPGSFYGSIDLTTNPAQTDSTVSQTYTVKNVELSYQMETTVSQYLEGLCAFIMYIPEGYVITETLPSLHPEWIMAYRWLGSPDTDGVSTIGRLPSKIKTRMARRLQSGDRIILLITGLNQNNVSYNINFSGLLRWWTKAN